MIDQQLKKLYDGYYSDSVIKKRRLSAADSLREIRRVTRGNSFNSVLDVGAGDGAVLQELSDTQFSPSLSAVEISTSGIEAIQKRNIPNIKDVQLFDGYRVPYLDKTFDLAISIYVLEHVEHERLFLQELKRVAKSQVIAVPLEHTISIKKARARAKSIGHINFYTLHTFENLLQTSGLVVRRMYPYVTSAAYEKLVSPKLGGLKFAIRRALLSASTRIATSYMSYLAIAYCGDEA